MKKEYKSKTHTPHTLYILSHKLYNMFKEVNIVALSIAKALLSLSKNKNGEFNKTGSANVLKK